MIIATTTTTATIATITAFIATTATPPAGLTPGGWISMILSCGFVITLCIWTLVRVLGGDKKRK